MTTKWLTDVPIQSSSEDKLDLNLYAETLSSLILSAATPITISIQGEWGSGKTSLMKLIGKKIEGEANKLWFNAWEFSQFNMGDNLSISLLSVFIAEVCKISGKAEDAKEARKLLYDLLKILTPTSIHSLAKACGLDEAGEITLKDTAAALLPKLPGVRTLIKPSTIEALREKLKNLVEKINGKRIVIFIDDLDRLLPERAVEVLEVLKLFLDIEKCVFVLACDVQVIRQGAEKKFGLEKSRSRDFFDKIIQVPFSMPVGQYEYKAKDFIRELLIESGIEENELKQNINLYFELIRCSVTFNPRVVKRLINSIRLLKPVLEEKPITSKKGEKIPDGVINIHEKIRILFAVLCLKTAYELDYLSLIQLEFIEEKLSELRESSKGFKRCFIESFREAIKLKTQNTLREGGKLTSIERDTLIFIIKFSAIVMVQEEGKEGLQEKGKEELQKNQEKPPEESQKKLPESFEMIREQEKYKEKLQKNQEKTQEEGPKKLSIDEERLLNKNLINKVILKAQEKYREPLRKLSSKIKEGGFQVYQPPRKKDYYDFYIIMYLYFSSLPEKCHFVITHELLFAEDKKYIQHSFRWGRNQGREDSPIHKWFKILFRESFKDSGFDASSIGEISITNQYYITLHKDTSPPTTREEFNKQFEETTLEVLGKFLPKLAELQDKGQFDNCNSILEEEGGRHKVFLDNLLSEIKKEYKEYYETLNQKGLINSFVVSQTGGNPIRGGLYLNLKTPKFQDATVVFSYSAYTKDCHTNTHIGISIFRTNTAWFNENLRPVFEKNGTRPESSSTSIHEGSHFDVIYKYDFPENISTEERDKHFSEKTKKVIEILFPELIKLHNDNKL